jgi:FkbH-like protein
MNQTTRRYTEAEVEALGREPSWRVFSVAAKDRFGDHGIVGAIFIKINEDNCHIDTFLLSCRVLGLNLEKYMIAFAAVVAKRAKVKKLVGEFIPTSKNKVAADMYPKLGFEKMGGTLYGADVERPIFETPKHIKPAVESFLPVP